jgi:hypothetical protein
MVTPKITCHFDEEREHAESGDDPSTFGAYEAIVDVRAV